MDKSQQTPTIESTATFFIEYPLLWVVCGLSFVVLLVAMLTWCLRWPKRLDAAARRKKTDEQTPDDKTTPKQKGKSKTVRFTESSGQGLTEGGHSDSQREVSRLGESEETFQKYSVTTNDPNVTSSKGLPQDESDHSVTSQEQLPQGEKEHNVTSQELPQGKKETGQIDVETLHKDSSRLQEDDPAIRVTNGETPVSFHIQGEETRETGQVTDQVPLVNGWENAPLENGEDDVDGCEYAPLENGEDEVALVNGCEESEEWTFPPCLDDFNLMDTDTDPSELETIFADERLAEIKLKIEPEGRGLGISIVGGSGSPNGDLPIIIKRILPGSLAEQDGRLKAGDELVAVNETLLVGVRKDYAIDALSNMEGRVRLLVLQDY